jgi:hypothetical protein
MTAAIGTVPSVSNADVRTPDVGSPTSDARLSGHRTGNFALQTQLGKRRLATAEPLLATHGSLQIIIFMQSSNKLCIKCLEDVI